MRFFKGWSLCNLKCYLNISDHQLNWVNSKVINKLGMQHTVFKDILSICLSICLFLFFLFVYLYVYMSVSVLFVCIFVCLSTILKDIFLFFSQTFKSCFNTCQQWDGLNMWWKHKHFKSQTFFFNSECHFLLEQIVLSFG